VRQGSALVSIGCRRSTNLARVSYSRVWHQNRVLRLTVALALACVACARQASDETPERTVQEFIDRMQRVHGDTFRSRAAYELLAAPARANLEERARRASAAVGRTVAPEEMLAPSRFYLSFQPRSWTTERGADWAIVTAVGESRSQRKQIRCVREQGRWRVVLDLPELPPLEHRDPSG
jgi:hypothetical protein